MNLALLTDPELWRAMLTGLQVTAIITILSIGLGFLLALPIAAARTEGGPGCAHWPLDTSSCFAASPF